MNTLTVLAVIASVSVQVFGLRVHPRLPPHLDGRIVGGSPTTIDEYPYQISLQNHGSHICGGSIISKSCILTAAHCTVGTTPEFLTVRAGSTYHNVGGEVSEVQKINNHPKYRADRNDYDVSVLVLWTSLTLGKVIELQPIGGELPSGTQATVTGWGAVSSGGGSPDQLQKVDVAQVIYATCNTNHNGKLTDRMTCFASTGKDSCEGDSGGPLVYNDKQVGVVSWGKGCADPKYPRVYTRISNSVIHNHIANILCLFAFLDNIGSL